MISLLFAVGFKLLTDWWFIPVGVALFALMGCHTTQAEALDRSRN